jgi:ATP-binding cassette, subfamily C (CFTR/MRP), member 1
MQCSIEAESVFGPQVAPECREGFDFTLLFEELILTLIPLVLVSLLLLLRLWQLLHQNLKVKVGNVYYLKLVVTAPISSN